MDDFKKALIQHIPGLLRYAVVLLGNSNNAEDLVQDCLERAMLKSHLWDQSKSLRTWLHAILHNLFVDHYRRDKKSPIVNMDVDDLMPSIQGNQFDHVQLHEIQDAMRMMSGEQREILLMVSLEGMDYKTISEVTEVPMGTVMSRLFRARKQLLVLLNSGKNTRPVM